MQKNKKQFLCAVKAYSEKTGKLETQIFTFDEKKNRDSFFRKVSPNVVFAAISDTEMAAKAMGALGGAKKSAKKKKSSAANGKLGGRPKKAVLK
jgi:hypothetical protein